jgi:phage FluMu protein Com
VKYRSKKCGTEFQAIMDVVCPKCHETREIEVIYKYRTAAELAGKI